jgi:hypothetical protein
MSNPQRPEREAIEQALREYTIQWRGVPVDIATVADALLAALPPTPTPRLPCYCCLESGCSDGCMCSRACSVCHGEDMPCAKCKGSGRELVAREAPADAPPATHICGDPSSACDAECMANAYEAEERRAAEPPAPPAQVLTPFTDQQEGQ